MIVPLSGFILLLIDKFIRQHFNHTWQADHTEDFLNGRWLKCFHHGPLLRCEVGNWIWNRNSQIEKLQPFVRSHSIQRLLWWLFGAWTFTIVSHECKVFLSVKIPKKRTRLPCWSYLWPTAVGVVGKVIYHRRVNSAFTRRQGCTLPPCEQCLLTVRQ